VVLLGELVPRVVDLILSSVVLVLLLPLLLPRAVLSWQQTGAVLCSRVLVEHRDDGYQATCRSNSKSGSAFACLTSAHHVSSTRRMQRCL